jgi:hypothetical protein
MLHLLDQQPKPERAAEGEAKRVSEEDREVPESFEEPDQF